MENLKSFQLWLEHHQFSASTIRNYLADTSRYLSSGLDANRYLLSLESDPNYPRYLSSLKKYIAFSLDQGLISHNPIHSPAAAAPTLTDYIFQYKTHLEKHRAPLSTVRNYLNDLIQYVTWLETNPIEPKSTN